MTFKSRQIYRLTLVFTAFLTLCCLSSCLGKKNTAAKRNYSAFITRYNIYYNGDTHFKETLSKMESGYEDDYSRQVLIHPVMAKTESTMPQPSGDFTRSIEKAQKAIQLRSIKNKPPKKSGRNSDPKYREFMSREEYNPFIHNAWLMMGRSQYYNGDFSGAATTFFYISRHFKWLPEVVTEAKLMQAISYLSMDWVYEADIILGKIKEEELKNDNLRLLYNRAMAALKLDREEYEEALPYLRETVRLSSGAQKTRMRFLLGQILTRTGNKEEAYRQFKKAGSSSAASYRTKFNARIKESEVYSGSDIKPEVNALKRMTRYDRNKEYLDQIYYAIGNLYLSRQDTSKAIENYRLAAEKSTRKGIDFAISQLTLGSLYFDRRNYLDAQVCYSEAIPQLPENYPDYKSLKKRSDVLDALAVYAQNVKLQDSLLALASMSEEARMAVIEKIIKDLKKKTEEEEKEKRRQEFLDSQEGQSSGNINGENASSPKTFNLNTDKSWYFYNTTSRNAGKTAFQKKWGSRKLEDDWRRKNKTTFNTSDFDSEEDGNNAPNDSTSSEDNSQEGKNETDASSDPFKPEYYLKDIPFTEEQQKSAKDIIQEGLYNMGLILKDRLDDTEAALAPWERLLREFPDNIYRLDTYYNIYLMAMRHNMTALAEKYKTLIMSDFPESPYAEALKNPDYIENLKRIDSDTEALYDKTFKAYMENDNAAVHQAYATMKEKYPSASIMPKFMFLEALAFVSQKEPEKFNSTLREMLERYPDTELSPIVSSWLTGMAKGRKLQTDGTNMRGMLWSTRLSNDSTSNSDSEGPRFELNADNPQYLVFLFPTDSVSSNALLYEIARHNFKSFVVKDFDLEQINYGRLGILIVKGFENLPEVEHYIKVMTQSEDLRLPAQVRPVIISENNFKALMGSGGSFEQYFNFLDGQNYEYAQEGLIPKEEIETLQEADEAPVPEDKAEETESPDTQDNEQGNRQVGNGVTSPQTPAAPAEPSPATGPATKQPAQPDKNKSAKPAVPKPKPKPKPVKPAVPKPAPSKPLPEYEPGSEGDDPLLD